MAKRKKPRKSKTKSVDDIHYSTIDQHKRKGKVLTPPLADIPKLQPSYWLNDWMPEMLWAALLLEGLGRENALDIFRTLADSILKSPDKEKMFDVTHTSLSRMPEENLSEILKVLTQEKSSRDVLKPLLIFDEMPAYDLWREFIDQEPLPDDWELLSSAVVKVLFHQSQEATDCRWVKLLCTMAGGKLRLPSKEMIREYVEYPNHGDMRKVRPSIRATEMAFREILDSDEEPPREWASQFWQYCLANSGCYPFNPSISSMEITTGTTVSQIDTVFSLLVDHARDNICTSAPDAKYDIVFGIALYCLSILKEIMGIGLAQSILARVALRILLEAYVTLVYLLESGSPEIWNEYRIYGAGQAKLTYLKMDEWDDVPQFIYEDTLSHLANEDVWQEFLPINFGHWEGKSLRDMSISSDIKEAYDMYYPWSSAYVHAHWGAIRDSVFDYCGNPLHRLHRIPRESRRNLPDVIPDACNLMDKILDLLSEIYPGFQGRVTIMD